MTDLASALVQRLLAVLEEQGLPVAVYSDRAELEFASPAWRTDFSDTPREVLDAVHTVANAGSSIELRELCITTRATPAYYDVTIRSLHSLGAPGGALVMAVDVTDQVLACTLEAPRRALIWSGKGSPSTDYTSQAWSQYTGNTDDWRELVHTDDAVRCIDAFHEAARYRTSTDIAVRLRRDDGEYRWFRMHFACNRDDARWYGVAVDIHAAQLLESQRAELVASVRTARADADRANRIKDEFLAVVSHELRSPVTTMLLWEKILREQTDPIIRQQALDAIRQSALAQSRLVGDLLDITRAASGKLSVDRRPVAIDEVIDEAIAAALPAAQAKTIGLSRGGMPSAVVDGDFARLRQILDNLISNAIKFSEPGSQVQIRLDQTKAAEVVIEIQDTGRGIGADVLERIFEPFQQFEEILTRRQDGLGLGLAIARELVALHDGTLIAASQGPGLGATFTLTLPVSSARHVGRGADSGSAPQLHDRHVLVIDDDERVRDALAYLLERAGAKVETADSAARGRERIARASPDIIVCDIAMPGEDGYSFIRGLRGSGHETPAIALTAHATEADAARAREAGFDLHLAKPVSFERLVTCIHGLIAHG